MPRSKKESYATYACLECGRKLTDRQAINAYEGDGCPKCGSMDIDLHVPQITVGLRLAQENGR